MGRRRWVVPVPYPLAVATIVAVATVVFVVVGGLLFHVVLPAYGY